MWDWRYTTACLHVDPEIFYALDVRPGSPAVQLARRVCTGRPARKICVADVMAAEDPARRWGITGGLTPAGERYSSSSIAGSARV